MRAPAWVDWWALSTEQSLRVSRCSRRRAYVYILCACTLTPCSARVPRAMINRITWKRDFHRSRGICEGEDGTHRGYCEQPSSAARDPSPSPNFSSRPLPLPPNLPPPLLLLLLVLLLATGWRGERRKLNPPLYLQRRNSAGDYIIAPTAAAVVNVTRQVRALRKGLECR